MSELVVFITCLLVGRGCVKAAFPLGCDDGWELFGDKCFYVNLEKANWMNAREECASLGGFLAEPKTNDLIDFVNRLTSIYQKPLWVGGSDLEIDGEWVWSSSRLPISGLDIWLENEPNGGTLENCLVFTVPDYGNDDRCEKTLGYICEKEPNQNTYSYIEIEEGKKANLTCPGTETVTHTPDIVWTKGTEPPGERLTINTRVTIVSFYLVFNSVLLSDSGIYTCSYYAGSTEKAFSFNVTVITTKEMCQCDCSYKDRVAYWANQTIPNRTYEELVEYLQPILQKQREELLVDKRNLTSAKRKRLSAPDSRESSATMGYISVFFICTTVGFVISADIANILKNVCYFNKN